MQFLIQSTHAWQGGAWQRPHHLATRFARAGHGVRWIESRYLRWLVDDRARFMATRGGGESGVQARAVTLVNGERFGPVRSWNLRRQMRALTRGGGAGPRVLWIYNPHEGALADLVPHDLLVYDIMDDHPGFPWAGKNLRAEEAALLSRADLVIAATHALYESKQQLAEGRIECMLSGVATEDFARPPGGPNLPEDLKPFRERYAKLLGYAGMLDFRIDQPLLARAAAHHPEWGFVMVGPEAADFTALRGLPNIHFLGAKPYSGLGGYYHAWDAALIPFKDCEVTRNVNPTKMLEYAAAGVPVLAPALPELERFYAGGSWLYKNAAEFEAMAEGILSGSDPDVAERLAVAGHWADERSWDAIAMQMLNRVDELLGEGKARKK